MKADEEEEGVSGQAVARTAAEGVRARWGAVADTLEGSEAELSRMAAVEGVVEMVEVSTQHASL
jgi:hypothetical protein